MCTLAAVNSVVVQAEDEYMISDYDLFVNKFISVPKDMGALNCAAFVAGIVKGVLDGAGFRARSAHSTPSCSAFLRALSIACETLRLQDFRPLKDQVLSCRVTAHFVPVKGQPKPKTTILMKFDGTVLAREHRLPSL